MALEKQNVINFLPDGFETLNQEGYKENFSADKIATGYEKDVKDRVTGPNLNNLIDVIGKNTNTVHEFLKYFEDMPVGSVPIVNDNNNLDYASGFVQKSGDTMTGELTLTSQSDCQQRFVTDNYGLMFRNDGENFYMLPTNAGEPLGHWNDLRPFTLNIANGYITTSTPTASDNSSKLATTSFVKSVLSSSGNGLANITKAQNGAIDFNVGLKIRWGRVTMSESGKTQTATFKEPFTTSSPAVMCFRISGNTTTTTTEEFWCRGVSTTGFELYKENSSASITLMYIAVGY